MTVVAPELDTALRAFRRRLLPLLFAMYVVAYLDRVNVAFAAAGGMNQDIGLTPAMYGFGAGVFFLGYVLFEVPSSVVMHRVGARRWLARIMLTWGVVSMAFALVHSPGPFYVLRFLLGVAEAGFFPGVIWYLTLWLPPAQRARHLGLFLTATALATAIGAPLSEAILLGHGMLGLDGWRWLFLIEGLPAVVLALVVWRSLPDGPRSARWLTLPQQQAITDSVEQGHPSGRASSVRDSLRRPAVWALGVLYLLVVTVFYGLGLWIPLLLKSTVPDQTPLQRSLLTALPYVLAAAAMVLLGRSSDRRAERRWHIALPLLIGAAALLAVSAGGWGGYAALVVATVAVNAVLGVFWTVPPAYLAGIGAAAGIALVNSVGNVGGFLGPYTVGLLATPDGFARGLTVLAACALAAALGVLWLLRPRAG